MLAASGVRAPGQLVADCAYPVPGPGISVSRARCPLVHASAQARASPRRKDERMAVEIGQEAPDFELKNQHGEPVQLSSFRGSKNVVLVFYPLAFSGVCTSELCALRDDFPEVTSDDVELLTVSVDSTYSLRS